MRKILLLALVFVTSLTAFGQDFSNKGKDFWLCFPQHVPNSNNNFAVLSIFITSDLASTGTITMPNGAYSGTFSIAANGLQEIQIPWNPNIHIKNSESSNETITQILKKSIHIKTDPGQPAVVAYAQQWAGARSAATLLLPNNVLGKKYRAVSFTQNGSNFTGQPPTYPNPANQVYSARSQFQVIAINDNTDVRITPVKNGVVGTPFTINLPLAGDMIQYQSPDAAAGSQDLTGTLIESIASGSSGCLPIAVFSGSSNNTFGTTAPNCNGTSYDPLWQQCYPVSTWGKSFGFIPFSDYLLRGNPYRIMAAEDNTNVFFDGTLVATLNAGQIYPAAYTSNPVTLLNPTSITADKPISVAQYAQADACSGQSGGGRVGDPDMVILNPIEQNISDITIFSSNRQSITRNYINVLMQTVATGTFRINGAAPSGAWQAFPTLAGYSYLRQLLGGPGSYRLSADSGFNAIAYGWGNVESYAYSAGTNVRDLNTRLEISNPNSIDPDPSACTNSPFRFKVYFADSTNSLTAIRYDSIKWEVLANASNFVPNNFPVMVRPTPPSLVLEPDSVNTRNGKYVAWYSLPSLYYVTAPGIYPIRITLYRSSSEGCGNSVEYEFNLTVTDPPTASFNAVLPGCYLEPVVVTETTPQIPKATYKLWWEFYDPVTNVTTVYTGIGNAFRTISHTFTTPGTIAAGTAKRIRHSSITTPGCLSDTIVQIIELPDIPNATIAGTTAVCVNAASPVITFTGTDGTPGYTFTYTINGGAPQTVSSVGTATTATVTVPTTVSGVFTYNLISIKNTGSTLCTRVISGQSAVVTVNPLPTASITGTTAVCQNAPSPLITFTGAAGTAPYTFTYNINGGASQVVTTVAGNSVTVAAPTNVVGVFTYNLESVLDASSTLCTQPQGGSAVITVNPLPTASITGTTQVCKNAASPLITFTGADGTAPYTFTYNINGGANQIITTVAGNSVTIAAPTNVVGTFTYNLISVADGSSTICTQAQSGSAIITVNDLPTASIAGTIIVCLNAPSPNITFTGANTTAPYTFSYTINGGPIQTVTTVAGNSVTVPVPTNVAGTFTYDLVSVQDGSSTLCSQAQTGSAVVTVNPLPTAAIAGDATVCKNAASPLITFTGAVGTAPYTFTYNINGGANQTVTTVAGNSVTVPAPTNVVGVFTYNLVSVQEGSPNACSQAQSGSVVVTVNELPTASISGTTEVCLNDVSPLITFTGASTVAPYTFTYTINGGANQTVTTVAGNSVTVPVPTGVAGTFTYALVSVQDGSSTTCIQAQSGSAVVTVHPLPTANFNYAAPSCETRTVSFTDASVPNVGTLTGWAWNFGDPGSGGNNTSTLQNPIHTFAAAGPYTVTLISTSSKGCSNLPFTKIVNIDNRPEAGFIIPEVCLSDTYAQFIDTSKLTNAVIDRWDWNFGDPFATILNPNTSNLQNPTHSYSAVGPYTVTLIVWNSIKGCRDTIVQTLIVNGSFPVADFNVNNPTTLCANDSVGIVEASTVFPGVITKIEIYWDNVNFPGVFQTDNTPFTGKVYRHLYPNFQAPLTKVFQIRYRAYSGGVCVNDKLANITVNAAPLVQFNNMPNSCLLVPPFQITQASEIGGVPGTGTYSGPGVSPTGLFSPQVAGVGTHTILYTFSSTAAGCVDTMSNTITVLDTAHAAFSVVLPACEQTPVSFTNLSTAPVGVTLLNTVWDFGDATGPQTFAIAAPVSHTYTTPGTYTVTMHNVSTAGCLSTDTTAVITIDANHHITWDAASGNQNQALCVNTAIIPIRYTLSGGATNVNFIPALPAGLTYTLGGTPLILTIQGAPTTPAGFNFGIQTTGNTCIVDNANITISVAPDHAIALRAGSDTAQSVCLNTPIDDIYYDLSGGATGVTISGLPAGVTYTVTGNELRIYGSPTAIPATPGYTITTTGNSCLTASKIGEIVVHPYPVPAFTVDKPGYCIPNAIVTFTNGSTMPDASGMTYLWNFDDLSSGAANTSTALNPPPHWFYAQRQYDVRLEVKSLAVLNNNVIGCESIITKPLTTIHPQPKADFVFSKPSVCIGDNVLITDNTDGKDGIVNQWHWDMGDGTTRLTNPLTYTYADTITYTITMYSINTFGCNSDTINKTFTVYPYPYRNAGPDKFVLEGGSVELEATGYAREPQYTWTPIDYLTDSKILRPRVVNPKTDMTYRLTVTGKGGCAASDDVFVKLLKFPVIPNTFTPNGDGINDTWRIDFLNTYPNNRVQIFTRAGNLVFESRGYNTPWDGTLKGKPMPFDTYYYIIEPGNGRDPITGYVTIIK